MGHVAHPCTAEQGMEKLFVSSGSSFSAKSRGSQEDKVAGFRDLHLRTPPKNNARAHLLSKSASSPDFLDVHTSSTDSDEGDRRKRRGSFLRKVRSMILLSGQHSTGDEQEIYTYVCQRSRMLHRSHGADGSIIDMF